jgi:TPR repeat protein
MKHAQFLVILLMVIALGCGENNPSSHSSYQPTSQPEANPSPAENNPSPGVTPTPVAPVSNVPNTTPTPVAAATTTDAVETKTVQAPVAPTAPTVNKTAAVVDPPAKPEPEYATLAAADLQKLADEGDPQASWILGLRFETGSGVATNAVTAYQWVTMAAARSKGVHRSLIEKDKARIAAMLTAVQIQQSAKPANDFLQQRNEAMEAMAGKGDIESQFELGLNLYHGNGIVSDKKKAAERFTQAAEQGHVGASALLGRMYLNGDTVTKDLVQGYRLLERAASRGNTLAQADISEAPKTMTPAQLAEASEIARAFLGKKVALLEAIATTGDDASQFKLGLMFYLGTEIPKDLEKAAQWFQKAGEQGHAEAPALLAGMHFSGEGLEKSFVQAYKWHGIAKGRGNTAATANQTEVAKLLTAEEKAATNKEVTAWLAAHPKKK